MLSRTQTVYVDVDSFLSPGGKVLHHFEQFLAGLADAQIPCIWITGRTRAQLDEPRRRLGQNHPYIGESGCGVYLPEDYFHLKGSQTIRLGRYTCIAVAKPQPAAVDALAELSSDLDIAVVPLRKLSSRELSLNTGLHGKEAEQVRMRDFDELFFFAGGSEDDVDRFGAEAKARGLIVQRAGSFWSLSCGADLGRCVRELGGLYDRALRAHALRIGLRLESQAADHAHQGTGHDSGHFSAFDRTLEVTEGSVHARSTEKAGKKTNGRQSEEAAEHDRETFVPKDQAAGKRSFRLGSPAAWDELVNALTGGATPRQSFNR